MCLYVSLSFIYFLCLSFFFYLLRFRFVRWWNRQQGKVPWWDGLVPQFWYGWAIDSAAGRLSATLLWKVSSERYIQIFNASITFRFNADRSSAWSQHSLLSVYSSYKGPIGTARKSNLCFICRVIYFNLFNFIFSNFVMFCFVLFCFVWWQKGQQGKVPWWDELVSRFW